MAKFDLVNTVAVFQGDLISIKAVVVGTASGNINVVASVELA